MDAAYEVIAFYVLAALTLGAALGVMAARGLFHAVLLLIVTFVGIAGFFVLLSAEFLAMAQIVIYVGAISVLLLFAVLLTPGGSEGRRNPETAMLAPAVLLCVAMATVFLFVIVDADWTKVDESPLVGAEALGRALVGPWV
ncbi:MAG: NADH-quinone oxidoreductase subunit J, partial [Dehalococcoidia bacterium]